MDEEAKAFAMEFGGLLQEEERQMVDGAIVSITKAEYMIDTTMIDGYRSAGFQILTAGDSLHVLPPFLNPE